MKKRVDDNKQVKRVSVVMCTYNGEKFIKEQIDSILNQSYPIYELIIQDDGSTDATVSIIEGYCEKDNRIKCFVNPERLGYNNNFSSAFYKATGDFIAPSDQDDIWVNTKIEIMMQNIGQHALLFHNSLKFTNDVSDAIGTRYVEDEVYNELYLVMKPRIAGHSCFFNKNILSFYKQAYELEKKICYDMLLVFAAYVYGTIYFHNECLVYWRRHEGALTNQQGYNYTNSCGLFLALKSLFDNSKRSIITRYFRAIQNLPFQSHTRELICLMAQGSISGIVRACFICSRHEKELYPNVEPHRAKIKSFFRPLYLIRDWSNCVIN